MLTLARIFFQTALFGLLVSSVAVSIGVDKRGLYDWAGSGFSLVNRMVWSKEANRLACEKYGFVDPEFMTGGSVSDHNFILGAGIQAFNTLAPSEVLKASCIDEGFYHPDRVSTNTNGNTKPEELHEKQPAQSETKTETDKTGQGKEIVSPAPPMELEKEEPEPQIQPQIQPPGTETRMEANPESETEAGESETKTIQSSEPNPPPSAPVSQEPVKSFNVAENKGDGVEREKVDQVSDPKSEPNLEKPMVNGPRKIPVEIHHQNKKPKPVASGRGDANANPVTGTKHKSPLILEEGIAR